MTVRYICKTCGEIVKFKTKPCPDCYQRKLAQENFIYFLDRAKEDEHLTEANVEHINRLITEYIATHWTEKDNPRHEVMEAVCRRAA